MSDFDSLLPDFGSLDELVGFAGTVDMHIQAQYPGFGEEASGEEDAQQYDDSHFFSSVDGLDRQEALPETCKEEAPLPPDEDAVQMYLLRRKYEGIEASELYEQQSMPQDDANAWIPERPEDLNDEELFLYALTKYAMGIPDEAGNAVSIMEGRMQSSSLMQFLPTYVALENNSSRRHIAELCRLRSAAGEDDAGGHDMTAIAQRMLRSVKGIIDDAEALQTAGYRNRQQALQKAVETARARVQRLIN